MDERLRFVARLLEGEKMAPLCAEFGISRKTGYKIFDRYKDCGRARPSPTAAAGRIGRRIGCRRRSKRRSSGLKREYPGWGAPKIREKLRQQFTGPHLPAISTVHAVLDRHGLVQRRRRRRDTRRGHDALAADRAERAVVRRLQRRVHARQSPVLLPADDHRLRQPLPARLRSARRPRRSSSPSPCSSATFKEFGLPAGDPHRQRRARSPSPNALYRPQQARGVVAPPGHSARAHQARPSAAERPARAHASDAEERGDQAGRAPTSCSSRPASTTSSTRYNHERPHQALGDEGAGRALRALTARLSRPRGARPIRFTTRPSP